MKLLATSLILITVALTGCVVLTGTDPDKAKKYAAIRELPAGEFEISIHSRNYRGIWKDGFFEFQTSTYCSIKVKGNGPFYKDPDVTLQSYRQAKYKGIVSVLESQKTVTIDLRVSDSLNKELDGTSFYYNGKFRIRNEN